MFTDSGDYVDISAYNYFELALDEINRLEGILHRVANRECELSRLAEKAHDATRNVNDGLNDSS